MRKLYSIVAGAFIAALIASAAKADGPERIHGEWWRSDSETNLIRDYYRVETSDGARYWIFRDAPAEQGGGWWLHGVGEA